MERIGGVARSGASFGRRERAQVSHEARVDTRLDAAFEAINGTRKSPLRSNRKEESFDMLCSPSCLVKQAVPKDFTPDGLSLARPYTVCREFIPKDILKTPPPP